MATIIFRELQVPKCFSKRFVSCSFTKYEQVLHDIWSKHYIPKFMHFQPHHLHMQTRRVSQPRVRPMLQNLFRACSSSCPCRCLSQVQPKATNHQPAVRSSFCGTCKLYCCSQYSHHPSSKEEKNQFRTKFCLQP